MSFLKKSLLLLLFLGLVSFSVCEEKREDHEEDGDEEDENNEDHLEKEELNKRHLGVLNKVTDLAGGLLGCMLTNMLWSLWQTKDHLGNLKVHTGQLGELVEEVRREAEENHACL
ncbi:PREDICTED: preprofallaxidin-5-like [Nanorana parkeri]|uniref:preprofallaxidin-5-like n=1 Tax=Nanorana parkeri TaxID=125878 RepID=UPI000854ADAA|nr:PREDICTED: preprofallaxidin-5-like [Nanorana parkeri]